MGATVFVVDDDDLVARSVETLLTTFDIEAEALPSACALLERCPLPKGSCVVSDVRMPGMSGLSLLETLRERGEQAPVVLLTGYADFDIAVAAFRRGAADLLRKPYSNSELVRVVQEALKRARGAAETAESEREAKARLQHLSGRELEVAHLLVRGLSNKMIGRELDISYRTVEHHRRRVIEKTGASSVVELSRLLQAAKEI